MRILHLLDSYAQVGGAEAYAHQVIQYLERVGHANIVVFAMQHETELQYPAQTAYHLPLPDYPRSTVEAIARLEVIVAREQPDVAFVHHIYHPDIVAWVLEQLPAVAYVQGPYLFCPGYRQYLPRTQCTCPHTAGAVCLWNAQVQRCMWGLNPIRHLSLLQRTLAFIDIYRGFHRIIIGSSFMRDMLRRNGLPEEKLVISPTFLLDETLQPLTPSRQHQTPVILFSGRLIPEKGLHHLLEALREIPQPWRLVVAGTGPEEIRCRGLAAVFGITEKVTFRGWVTPAEMDALLGECDIAVVPSLWPEPFGRVGPEAFVHGKPVVAYASGGIPDWLHDGFNGLLVPAADIVGLRRALARLLVDPDLRRQLGKQAHESVLREYPIEKHMTALIELLQDASKSIYLGRPPEM